MKDWVDHLPRLDGTSRYIVQNKTARYLEGNALVSPHDGGPAIRKDILALGVKTVAYLPLISEGGVVGILYVNLTDPHRFSTNEKQLLELFADHAAIAIKNAWLYEQRAKDIAALQKVNEAITTAPRTEIIGLIAQKARELTQAEYIGVWTVDGDRLVPGAMYGLELVEIPELPIDEDSINGWVAMTEEPYKCFDVDSDPHYRVWRKDIQSSVAFPLKFAGRVIGTLGAESTERNAFSDYQLELLQSLANQAAIAIENARLYDQRSKDIAALQEINEAVVSKTSSEILDLIVKKAVEVMPGEYGELWLKEPTTGDLVLRSVCGPAEAIAQETGRLKAGVASINVQVAETGQPYICDDVRKEPNFYPIYQDARSSVTVPLEHQGEVIGTLNVESPRLKAFAEQHSQLLNSFADQAAIAVENAHLYEQRNEAIKQLERQVANLNAVNEVGQTLTASVALSEGQILELIYRQATPLMDTSDMYIALYEPDPEQPDEYNRKKPAQSIIHGTVRFGLARDNKQRVDTEHEEGWGPRKAGHGLTEYVIRTRQPFRPADVGEAYKTIAKDYIGKIPKSWMGVPMMMGDEVLGVVVLRNDEHENVYDEDDLEVLQTIASQSAIALQNARLVQQLEQRVQELDTLRELAEELSKGTLLDVA
jgi:GAF domain-containing protein